MTIPEFCNGIRSFEMKRYREAAMEYERASTLFERFGEDYARFVWFAQYKRIRAQENISVHEADDAIRKWCHDLNERTVVRDEDVMFTVSCLDFIARYALSRNDVEVAIEAGRRAVTLGNSASSRVLLGLCTYAVDRSDEHSLRSILDEALEDASHDVETRWIDGISASLEYASGRFERAEDIWQRCLANEDDDLLASLDMTRLGRSQLIHSGHHQDKRLASASDVLRRATNVQSRLANDVEEDDASRARVQAHLAYTLAILGGVHHALEKAVTAEGLLRSATDEFDELQRRDMLTPQETLMHAEALHVYSRLLGDWDKRESEARALKERGECLASSVSNDTLSPLFVIF